MTLKKECRGQDRVPIAEPGETEEAEGHSWGPDLRSVAPASRTALALSSSAASSEAKSKLTGVGQILFKCHDDQSMKHSV